MQLYDSGRAKDYVSSSTKGGSDTVVKNWPDVIKCVNAAEETAVFWFHGTAIARMEVEFVMFNIMR